MKKTILLLTLAFGFTNFSKAQKNEIEPTGIYKEIDITRHNEAIEVLNGDDHIQKQQTVDLILRNPNFYNPPVIYALSRELFSQDKKSEATYWFYIAQLRARYDANLCMDNTAKQAVSILNEAYGSGINQFAFKDIEELAKTVTKVVDFVRTNEENYDHRWINLHGMDAILASMDGKSENKKLSQPKDQWTKIKNKTIDDYYNGFIEYVIKKK